MSIGVCLYIIYYLILISVLDYMVQALLWIGTCHTLDCIMIYWLIFHMIRDNISTEWMIGFVRTSSFNLSYETTVFRNVFVLSHVFAFYSDPRISWQYIHSMNISVVFYVKAWCIPIVSHDENLEKKTSNTP